MLHMKIITKKQFVCILNTSFYSSTSILIACSAFAGKTETVWDDQSNQTSVGKLLTFPLPTFHVNRQPKTNREVDLDLEVRG